MKITVNFQGFLDAFRAAGQHVNFSYDGLKVLFSYLEDLEEDSGTEEELYVNSLCCDYSEHPSARAAAAEYSGWEPEDAAMDDAEQEAAALEWLRYRTTVIEVKGGSVIVLGF